MMGLGDSEPRLGAIFCVFCGVASLPLRQWLVQPRQPLCPPDGAEGVRIIRFELLGASGAVTVVFRPLLAIGHRQLLQCARAGRWHEGVVILEKMKGNPEASPDARSFASLIDACAKAENWEKGLYYLNDMQHAGVT